MIFHVFSNRLPNINSLVFFLKKNVLKLKLVCAIFLIYLYAGVNIT